MMAFYTSSLLVIKRDLGRPMWIKNVRTLHRPRTSDKHVGYVTLCFAS